jgi:dTDP-glucose 4,6-dehydratase
LKVLVTGGAGFIGSEFVRQAVKKDFEIIVIDKLTYAGDRDRIKNEEKNITFYNSDITDKEATEEIFETEKPEIVVHWAAESHVDRSILEASPFIENNIKGTQVLLDIARKFTIKKFINIATDEVYGDLGENGQFFEDTPLNPSSPYSVSKASADMLGRAYYRTFNLPVITLRPSNNYGPWQYPEKLLPVVIIKALNNERIPVYGKGENIREWMYVTDCAEAVFTVIEKGEINQIYNIGSGQEKRNIDVVKTVLKILGKPDELIEFVKDRPGHDFRYSLNVGKIERELGWKAKVNFNDGIARTVEWYLANMGWIDNKMVLIRDYWKKAYSGTPEQGSL